MKSLAEILQFNILQGAVLFSKYFHSGAFSDNSKPVILCFHSVGNDNWRFSMSKIEFERKIRYLSENKKIVSLSQIMTSQNEEKNVVSITFDDGYKNWHKNVLPICKKYNVTGSLFLLSSPDLANRDELDNNLPLLNKKEIRDFIKGGWEIGSHTMTHSDLRTLSNEQIEKEIVESKRMIEKDCNLKVNYFAYPRGIFNDFMYTHLKQAGYKAAFTVNGGFVNLKQNRYLINRVSLEGRLELEQFKILTSDFGITFYRYFMDVLKMKDSLGFRITGLKNQYLIFRRDLSLLINSPVEYIYSFKASKNNRAKIWPYNPKSLKLAKKVTDQIERRCPELNVHLVGSVPLGIAGDKDVDIVIECDGNVESFVPALKKIYGNPIKVKRKFVEWKLKSEDYNIEIVLASRSSRLFKIQMKTFTVLKNNSRYISEYEQLKILSIGCTEREYQRRRINFFNKILIENEFKNSKRTDTSKDNVKALFLILFFIFNRFTSDLIEFV